MTLVPTQHYSTVNLSGSRGYQPLVFPSNLLNSGSSISNFDRTNKLLSLKLTVPTERTCTAAIDLVFRNLAEPVSKSLALITKAVLGGEADFGV